AEPGKLAQVFTTLLVTAARSMEEGAANENEIRVSTRLDDGFVVVTVTDTGSPIPASLRERIFQPFFQTSGKEPGASLDLSLCAEIVRLHGGSIDLQPADGRGSRFEVRLPAVRPQVMSRTRIVPLEPQRGQYERARVLVIDDDVAV